MPNVNNTDLRPNQYALVAGTLVWSRVASQVDGDELAQIQRQRQEQGRPAPARPYTTVTLIDPKIVQADRKAPLTIEERYLQENRFYTARHGRNEGHTCFSPTNTGRFLPAIYRKGNAANGENPKQLYQVFTDKEIASNTKVMVLMRSFSGQMGFNGIAMNALIILDDHVNFFGAGNADAEALRQWGLVVNQDENNEVSPEKAAEIAAKTERVSANANLPVADVAPAAPAAPAPAPEATDDDLFDDSISQGISIDALFPDE